MSNLSGSFPREVAVRSIKGGELDTLIQREWLVTNGLGGYASGTVSGAGTRRYHGLLIAAHTAPLGRLMMLNHVREQFRFPGWNEVQVGGAERKEHPSEVYGSEILAEFRLESGLPVWRYRAFDHTIEKRVYLPYRHNTVHITYRLVEGDGPVRLKIRP
jgi:predicted glycogen debranching enzyme